MWDNPRLLNLLAGALVGVAALAFFASGAWMLMRSELIPVREISVVSAMSRTSKEEIHAAVRGHLAGNFFSVSPAEVRAGLEKLPWVRSASVRRVWPDRLEVSLEEHVALARWGTLDDDPQRQALINTYGERFSATTDQALPLFIAPAGTEGEVTRRYARFATAVGPLGAVLERVVLTPRFAWQLRLDSGLNIMLGRDADAAEARLARFVEVYEVTLKTIGRKHEYVDLRYPNGFALRIPDLKGT
jgi:cell division protein FtsQ